ncbi:MAG: hypothetical protein JO100_19045 [Pseudonocardia sp.]|nr:hypothetical protein [Pseudonocardia sp.]
MTKPLPSLATIVARLDALEHRVRDMEGSYGETLYRLRRESIRNDLRTARIMAHLGVGDVTEADIDAVLDAEA